jgi:hypothetical protein
MYIKIHAVIGSVVELMGPLSLTQLAKDNREVVSRVQSIGMALAQHPTTADQSVLFELTGLLPLTQLAKVSSEIASRIQGPAVIVT